jgi:microcystin-dependent protein
MSEPFIAEIRIFAGNFAPRDWAFCDGQILPIANNTALFSIIGTTYGGDGRTTMALPDMRGRAPMEQGHGPGLTPRQIGEQVGTTDVTLTEAEIPDHTHTIRAKAAMGGTATPGPSVSLAGASFGDRLYQNDTDTNLVGMSPAAITPSGGNQAHSNLQPFLVVNFIIALFGFFPSRG